MAKKGGAKLIYKLVSSAGTGFFYVGEKTTKFINFIIDKPLES
jgi:hypothetical protein